MSSQSLLLQPGRAPAQFASKNVATSGGLLELTTMLDPDFSYSSWVCVVFAAG